MTAVPGRAPLRGVEPNWYPPTPPRGTITFAGRPRRELPDEPLREATGYRDNPRESTTTPALPLWRRMLRAIGVLK